MSITELEETILKLVVELIISDIQKTKTIL